MLASYASFEWHDDPQFEEHVDEVMELEFHLDASEDTLRSILEGLDSTKDGRIDKNELGNELSKLGLEDIDFAFERLGLTGASLEDERTLQIFREGVFIQLALEKIRASQEQTIGFDVRIDILDYNQFVTNHFGGLGWSSEPKSSLDFSPTGLGHAKAIELWEDFLRMPRLQHGFYTVPPDIETDARETPARSQERMDTTSVPLTRWINIDGLDKTILRQLAVRAHRRLRQHLEQVVQHEPVLQVRVHVKDRRDLALGDALLQLVVDPVREHLLLAIAPSLRRHAAARTRVATFCEVAGDPNLDRWVTTCEPQF